MSRLAAVHLRQLYGYVKPTFLIFIHLFINPAIYVGGHLVMGLVVALMYDVLVWAHGGV